jgi:hypothetical protein
MEIKADATDQAVEDFRDAYKKFKSYIEYVETIPKEKRTMKQKELVAKYGKKSVTCSDFF